MADERYDQVTGKKKKDSRLNKNKLSEEDMDDYFMEGDD